MAQDQNKYPVQMTRKGVFVSGALIFFVMGWMFVLGILVGRGTAPVPVKTNSLEKELNALKSAMLNQAPGGSDAKTGQKQPQTTDLGFYEALKRPPPKQGYTAKIPSAPVRKRPEPAGAVGKKEITAAAASHAAAAKMRPVVKKEPAPQPAAQPARRAAPPAAPSAQAEHFTIQVAAFKDLQSAEQMVAKLRARHYPGYSLRADVRGKGLWFRVRVGAFQSRAAAEQMLARLKGDRFSGIVVGAR